MGAGNTTCKKSKSTENARESDIVEKIVCKDAEIKENEMKAFDVGDLGKVLVIRQDGKLSAISNKCSHYGAPLSTGILGKGHVRCPWHGACFNIKTGDIEDFPGLDSLPCFEVNVTEEGNILVKGRAEDIKSGKREKKTTQRNLKDNETVVVIGGGPAGAVCVETLRQEGFKGRVLMLNKENHLPYDRIKLSKVLDAEIEKIALRTEEFYKVKDIEVKIGAKVTGVDLNHKKVILQDGTSFDFNYLFIASGSSARKPSVEGCRLKNIFTLRSIDDANNINKSLNSDTNVVVVGGSFIGMEVAAYCVGKVKSVTIVMRAECPFKLAFGIEVGTRLMEMFQEKGVKFICNADVEALKPAPGGSDVGSVKLSNEETVPADVVIFGIGATPNTQFLRDTGVEMTHHGYVIVDETLQTNVPGIFAGGDIAHAPVLGKGSASIGHWQLAHYHGNLAAKNIMGQNKLIHTVPFFWTMLFGRSVRYAGYGPQYCEVVVTGDLSSLSFVAYYLIGNEVLAIATMGKDPIAAKFAELLSTGRKLTREEIDDDAWVKKIFKF